MNFDIKRNEDLEINPKDNPEETPATEREKRLAEIEANPHITGIRALSDVVLNKLFGEPVNYTIDYLTDDTDSDNSNTDFDDFEAQIGIKDDVRVFITDFDADYVDEMDSRAISNAEASARESALKDLPITVGNYTCIDVDFEDGLADYEIDGYSRKSCSNYGSARVYSLTLCIKIKNLEESFDKSADTFMSAYKKIMWRINDFLRNLVAFDLTVNKDVRSFVNNIADELEAKRKDIETLESHKDLVEKICEALEVLAKPDDEETIDSIVAEIRQEMENPESCAQSILKICDALEILDETRNEFNEHQSYLDPTVAKSVIREIRQEAGKLNATESNTVSESYDDYDPKDGWTEDDINTHKGINWADRNYDDFATEEIIDGHVYLYGLNRPVIREAKFEKVFRANPIYPPYWRPVDRRPFDDVCNSYVGPMADRDKAPDGYDMHNRFETSELYDRLSESLNEDKDNWYDMISDFAVNELGGEPKDILPRKDGTYSIVYGDEYDNDVYDVKIEDGQVKLVESLNENLEEKLQPDASIEEIKNEMDKLADMLEGWQHNNIANQRSAVLKEAGWDGNCDDALLTLINYCRSFDKPIDESLKENLGTDSFTNQGRTFHFFGQDIDKAIDEYLEKHHTWTNEDVTKIMVEDENPVFDTYFGTIFPEAEEIWIPETVTEMPEDIFDDFDIYIKVATENKDTYAAQFAKEHGKEVFYWNDPDDDIDDNVDLSDEFEDEWEAFPDDEFNQEISDDDIIDNLEFELDESINSTSKYKIENNVLVECLDKNIVDADDIPEGITEIGDDAFYECTNLTNVKIPNGVTRIGDYAFLDCIKLTHIEIPNSVTEIGRAAFDSCTSLPNIEIPDSVTKIGMDAFYGCEDLTSIKIGNGVTYIDEDYAFDECPNLIVYTDNKYVQDYCEKNCFAFDTLHN